MPILRLCIEILSKSSVYYFCNTSIIKMYIQRWYFYNVKEQSMHSVIKAICFVAQFIRNK